MIHLLSICLSSSVFFTEEFNSFVTIVTVSKMDAYLAYIFIGLCFFFFFSTFRLRLVPDSYQYIVESIYEFLASTINQQSGKRAQRYFIYFFVIFMFILFANLIGLIPFTFTVTAHIFQTFFIGCSSFIALTVIGFLIHKLLFFKLFLPSDLPVVLTPLLVVIELISYVSRAFSLSIRLFANMMSGHTLLNILASFSVKIFSSFTTVILLKPVELIKSLAGLFPILMIGAILFLEFGIAMLQAYVFIVLLSIYLKDSFKGGH